MIIAGDIVRQV